VPVPESFVISNHKPRAMLDATESVNDAESEEGIMYAGVVLFDAVFPALFLKSSCLISFWCLF
jgi:hypothetical protein